jgi:hypothetical protein
MRHINKPIWEKRIPTVFALLLMFGSIFITGYFLQQRTSTTGQASQAISPDNIEVSNITDSAFTVTFTTQRPAIAGIKVSGPNMVDSVFFSTTSQEALVTHSITVPNLSPQSQYSFSVLFEGETILHNNKPFSVSTAPLLDIIENQSTASGTIINTDGSYAANTLVLLTSNNSQTVSTVTDENGKYTFNLSNLRTKSLDKYATFTSESLFTLQAYFKDLSSRVEIPYQNIIEIPAVTLSQNYSFEYQFSETILSTPEAELTIPEPSTQISYSLSITSPREGQSLLDERPLLRGRAAPRTPVVLHINNRITQSTVSNASGIWEMRPNTPLTQGENSLVVQSKDTLGIQKSITRSFSLFASGVQIAQTATPSATLSPTQLPTASPTQRVTITPTATVAPTVTTTITPTIQVTVTAVPTATVSPTLQPTTIPNTPPILTITPTPPGSFTTVFVTVASVILIVTGSVLLFILG